MAAMTSHANALFVRSLLGSGLAPNVFLYFYTQHSINSAPEASAVSKKVRDVSKRGRGGGVSRRTSI